MFSKIGMQELLVIGGILLLVFGPAQIPRLGRSLGETLKELRGIKRDLRSSVDDVDAAVRKVRDEP